MHAHFRSLTLTCISLILRHFTQRASVSNDVLHTELKNCAKTPHPNQGSTYKGLALLRCDSMKNAARLIALKYLTVLEYFLQLI